MEATDMGEVFFFFFFADEQEIPDSYKSLLNDFLGDVFTSYTVQSLIFQAPACLATHFR